MVIAIDSHFQELVMSIAILQLPHGKRHTTNRPR
jgi:hypothetical protein